ncbi:MAG: DNA mismatch endonuclease Vsr [Candidatus Azobacteroides sp.]|nr:DNA mismatch endonuclease Vsr [Candidatus Azobacteroides sp.]
MDKLTPEQRRKNMQAVKGSGTKIERILGKLLWNSGLRYRKNDKTVFGKPDFVFKKEKIAVFCDGEFWHGKDWDVRKNDHKSNQAFWLAKIEQNIERDKKVNETLRQQGWTVVRLWESDIEKNSEYCLDIVMKAVAGKRQKEAATGITIDEIFGGKKLKIQLYGPHALKEDGSIMSFSEQMAVVTHFLQNKGMKNAVLLEQEAAGLIEDIYELKFPDISDSDRVAEDEIEYYFFKDVFSVPFPAPENPVFTFVDLFAGVGAFRVAMQHLGGKCVFSFEPDERAQKTYFANFGEVPFADLSDESVVQYIPDDVDILCANLPGRGFNLSGKNKENEKMEEPKFRDMIGMIRKKRPKAFFFGSIYNLEARGKGKILQSILDDLRKELNYFMPGFHRLKDLNSGSSPDGDRIYLVGFRNDLKVSDFTFPESADGSVISREVNDKDFHAGLKKMTSPGWASFRGFPDSFKMISSDTYTCRLFKNSASIPDIQAMANEILKLLELNRTGTYR